MYTAFVTRIKNLRKHTNADRLLCGECFGNTVIVDLSTPPEQLGVYFPVDGQLGVEFATKNDLLRRKDENGNPAGGYLDPVKRNIKALTLRGEKSDGLFLPLACLSDFTDISKLKEGDTISVLNGVTICEKYIPAKKSRQNVGGGNRTRKRKDPIAPLFMEHADTEQLAYNLTSFHVNDLVEITLKMHGTSQRTGYLPTLSGYRYKNAFLKKLYESEGTPDWMRKHITREPVYSWGYVTGTRRVVLDDYDGGFYGDNAFREQHAKVFEGKLHKGETVYYEVVGFTDKGVPIMQSADNKKTGDKEFIKQYGKTTVFSYGCSPDGKGKNTVDLGYPNMEVTIGDHTFQYKSQKPLQAEIDAPQSDFYVYRMTMTNEDGDVVEYPPDFMRYRCEQMGVKCVPLLWRGFVCEMWKDSDGVLHSVGYDTDGNPYTERATAGDYVKSIAEQYYDGPDPIGKSHVREGVVCRIVNRPKFTAYKHKNFSFKMLEGLIKDTAIAPDMEEQQEELIADAA